MCFLADLLFILSNFQKKLQRDSLTIVDIKPELEIFLMKLDLLMDAPLLGGWEETLCLSSTKNDNLVILFDHELWSKSRRSSEANRYVTDKRGFKAIRHDSIQSMKNSMSTRLHLGDNLDKSASSMSAFCNFTATEHDITLVRNTVLPDVELAALADEYADIQLHALKQMEARKVLQHLCLH